MTDTPTPDDAAQVLADTQQIVNAATAGMAAQHLARYLTDDELHDIRRRVQAEQRHPHVYDLLATEGWRRDACSCKPPTAAGSAYPDCDCIPDLPINASAPWTDPWA